MNTLRHGHNFVVTHFVAITQREIECSDGLVQGEVHQKPVRELLTTQCVHQIHLGICLTHAPFYSACGQDAVIG